MKTAPSSPRSGRGATMVEAVIAVGVLAVAIPMVFGAIAKSGESGIASQAETRSTWIVPACMREIRASREGRSTYFAATAAGQAFPPAGEVWAYFTDRVQPELLGQFTLTDFTNEKGLEAIGSNLFLETAASGPPIVNDPGTDGLGTLRQGYLEESSVDAVREITELIKAQRGYELNAKVITAADQMLGATTQLR